jgi:hypothetical protein
MKKTWREKLADNKGFPKVSPIDGTKSKRLLAHAEIAGRVESKISRRHRHVKAQAGNGESSSGEKRQAVLRS